MVAGVLRAVLGAGEGWVRLAVDTVELRRDGVVRSVSCHDYAEVQVPVVGHQALTGLS